MRGLHVCFNLNAFGKLFFLCAAFKNILNSMPKMMIKITDIFDKTKHFFYTHTKSRNTFYQNIVRRDKKKHLMHMKI